MRSHQGDSLPKVLLVEDDPDALVALSEVARDEGYEASTASTLAQAKAELSRAVPDVILTDLLLPDGSGLELLKQLDADQKQRVRFVLVTGHASVESAVEALREGACDYLTKPFDHARLRSLLAEAARKREFRNGIDALRTHVELGHFGPMIGASPAMTRIYEAINKVGPTEASVLITGESGTGKELVAQVIHLLSRRRKGPFLPVNCGAVSATLIESEVFGHERGSFTGAERVHKGHFERADGGTLFLDEVTEMPIELQAKLLRVLETGVVTRVGGEQAIHVDVRVIAATNRSPESAVQEGKLREDLFYRLKVFPIEVPPLRERGPDIELLARHFLRELNEAEGTTKAFTPSALRWLAGLPWTGNVRELKNLVHRAFILAERDITEEHLPVANPRTAPETDVGPSLQLRVGTPVAEAERRLILATLSQYNGEKKVAADVLGISLKTLYNRLNEYKLDEKS